MLVLMMSENIFEYESDWVEYFNAVLKNEIRDEIDNRNFIKANIVESNQTLDEFIRRNGNMEIIPSKEPFFHNVKIKTNTNEILFYINNENPRFWTIHNIEKQTAISNLIKEFTTNTFQQDMIYLSNETMELHQKNFKADSLGLTLNFEQNPEEHIGKKEKIECSNCKEKYDIRLLTRIRPIHG